MAKSKPLPPLDQLREIFTVDDEGRLYWKKKQARCVVVGKEITGKDTEGYIKVKLNRRPYRVHRIVWALIHGEDPRDFLIDHINGCPSDNRPENLRLCNTGQNKLNSKIPSNNKSGVTGVCFRPRRIKTKPWEASYKRKYLGCFATKEEAASAVKNAVEQCDDKSFYRFNLND
jgi:hypothetical protein